MIYYVYFHSCKKYLELDKAEQSTSTAVNSAGIPVQMTRGQSDEPEVHIGLNKEQTHKIENEVIPSDENMYLMNKYN